MKNKKVTAALGAIMIAGAVLAYALLLRDSTPITREQAIKQAMEFDSGSCGGSLPVNTPAVHDETDAEYTFSSSCIPDGWTRQI